MLRVGAKERHAAIILKLHVPVPFDLGQFVSGLERQRDRPIRLRPFRSGPGCPCGLWIASRGTPIGSLRPPASPGSADERASGSFLPVC